MSVAKCETGWGDGLSTRALFEARDCHPTPPLISFASTLPLQGRVKEQRIVRAIPDSIFKQPAVRKHGFAISPNAFFVRYSLISRRL